MKIEDVLTHFGGRAEAARALSISYQAVQQWEEKGEIPESRQFEIEVMTKGKLKAEKKQKRNRAA